MCLYEINDSLGRYDQLVPVALQVVVFGLFRDVQAVELQLTSYFLLPFENSQWYLWKKVYYLINRFFFNPYITIIEELDGPAVSALGVQLQNSSNVHKGQSSDG
jgi:hypothetical protein